MQRGRGGKHFNNVFKTIVNQSIFGKILHLSDNSRQCIVASEYSGARMAQNYYSMPAKNIAFFGEMQALSDSI